MTFSKLTNVQVLASSSNYTAKRTHKVCKITPHHMAAVWTAERCGQSFQDPNRQASSNYGIGNDGRIGGYVSENSRAWTSGSATNDHQAITIEVSNSGGGPDWPISDAAWNSLVNLCVDICQRHGFRLTYDNTPNGSLTRHSMFQATACPGPYLTARLPELATTVNSILDGGKAPQPAPTPTPQPTPTPAPGSGQILVLPASADTWRVYSLNVAPVTGNEKAMLKPKQFGGLEYNIDRMIGADIAVITTRDFGQVQIYVGKETGAVIKGSAPTPTPAPPKPAPPKPAPAKPSTNAGAKVTLKAAPLFSSSTSGSAAATMNGAYYIWDSKVMNNRIRITNNVSNVGNAAAVTGWVNVKDLK